MTTGVSQLSGEVRHLLRSLWDRRWLAVSVGWVLAIVAILGVMLVPNRYQATTQVHVDTQTVLKPLMQGLAVTPDLELQVRMLARTLISRPNVERLLDRQDLGLGVLLSPAEREAAVTRLMDKIKLVPVAGSGTLYNITYVDTQPDRARRMVEATLALFVGAGVGDNRRDSEEATKFIDEQIKANEAKLVDAEARLKDFKVRNFGVSGVSNQDYFARMSLLVDEVGKLRIELSAAEQTREAYRRELSGENPQLPETGATAGVPSELDARLEAQKKVLDELLRRFTDEHPDVVSTRRVITQLEAQKRRESAERSALGGTSARALGATSPVYQKIRVALAEAEAQVASIRSQLHQKEARLTEIRAAAGRVPQVEAELAQLNRDYDIINKNYQALVTRRESASLGVKLDESSRLADFRIVEPPRVSEKPVFPSRLHVAAMAALLVIVAAIAAPIGLEFLFPKFKDAAALKAATGRPVLGSIALTRSDDDRARMRSQGIGVAAACGALLFLQAGWILWLAGRLPISH
jgi:polysaccharide chain length determinant protein (PEP-CTERM system associated)